MDADNTDNPTEDVFGEVDSEYLPSVSNFKSVNELAKGYSNLEKMIGNSVRIPSNEASDEAKQQFKEKVSSAGYIDSKDTEQLFNALGRPSQSSEYEIDEEIFGNEYYKGMADVAHKAGLSKQQMNALLEYDKQDLLKHRDNMEATVSKTMTTLKQMYGSDLENRLHGANNYLNKLREVDAQAVEEIEYLAEQNPIIVKLLADAYVAGQEGDIKTPIGQVSYGKTPAQAEEEINDIFNNPDHPFHHNDASANEKMNRLFEIKNSGKR